MRVGDEGEGGGSDANDDDVDDRVEDDAVGSNGSARKAVAVGEKSYAGATTTGAPARPRAGAGGRAQAVPRNVSMFSVPSRAVVTFAICRSNVSAGLTEKRLFEVEALEHNTLQQLMGKRGREQVLCCFTYNAFAV